MNLLLHGIGTADGGSLIDVRDVLISDPPELGSAKWCVDCQVASAAVVAEIGDRKGEAVDLNAVERLQHRECELLVGRGEVEVGGESPCVAGAELAQCGPAL